MKICVTRLFVYLPLLNDKVCPGGMPSSFTRYRGLRKQTVKLRMMFALANLIWLTGLAWRSDSGRFRKMKEFSTAIYYKNVFGYATFFSTLLYGVALYIPYLILG